MFKNELQEVLEVRTERLSGDLAQSATPSPGAVADVLPLSPRALALANLRCRW
jgi:hypothetical protein